MPGASDDELMQAARGEEPAAAAAFAELMRRHRPWVCGLMRAFAGDAEQAEDLAQEAFCRVYRSRADYVPRGNFPAWLKRVAANVARDYLRSRRRAAPLVPLDDLEETPEPRFDPFAALASRALQAEIRAAIAALPPDQRQALVLHYFGGSSVEEIAQATGCPPGTVKSRLFHARRRVRAALTTAEQPRKEGAKGVK